MEKLRFEFTIKAGEDPKTNVLCITSVTDEDKRTYLFPEQLQTARLHEAVIKTQAYLKVKATLQKRHEKRLVWITLTPEMKKTYMDEDGNMEFKGYLLEEDVPNTQQQGAPAVISEEAPYKDSEEFRRNEEGRTEAS